MKPISPSKRMPLVAAILLLLSTAFPAFVEEGLMNIEAGTETATLMLASEPMIVGADFYTATASWGNLFPRKGVSSKFEKSGNTLALRISDTLGNSAVQRYTVASNGALMETEAVFAPSDTAKVAVWDVFLSRPRFAQAVLVRDGKPDVVLDTNRFETVDAENLTLRTAEGDWSFKLTGDRDVKWKLRSVCDRKWGSAEKQTFSLLYQMENMPPEGMKLKLAIDVAFLPKPGSLAEAQKRSEARAASFFSAQLRRLGVPAAVKASEDVLALSAAVARRSSELNENRIDPRAPLVIPQPKKMALGKGSFPMRPGQGVQTAHEGAYSLLAEDLGERGITITRAAPGAKANILFGLASDAALAKVAQGAGIKLEALKGTQEAYALSVKPDRIVAVGADLPGLIHAVQSLRQVLRVGASGLEAPAVEITDSPDLAFRGFYLEGAGTVVGTEDFRRLLRNTYSRFHANAVMAELRWSQIQWKSHPEISGPKARPLSELAAAAREAEALGMEFIPAVFTYGKVNDLLKSHPEIAEDDAWQKKGAAWCPNKPETYALIFDLLSEITAATGCKRIHIGHDEIQGMALCPACKAVAPDELFAGDVNKIADFLKAKGVGAMIWGDFLLDYKYWTARGVSSVNSANPQYGNLAVHPAVGKIRKDVVICDWHYEATKEYPSFKHFADAGYPVIGCPWNVAINNTAVARAIGAIKAQGVLVTDWGFLGCRAPGAVSILGVTHGWNLAQGDPEALAWDADAVLATSLMPSARPSRQLSNRQVPLDLGPAARVPLSGASNAWFDFGSRHDLALLPTGDQAFYGSRFRIPGKALVLSAKEPRGQVALGRKAKSLILLHALHADTLSVTPVNYLICRATYGDGKETNFTINHRNAAHWLSKTARKNAWGRWNYAHTWDSLLAWEGVTRGGELVNLQAWEWVNPRPEVPLVALELRLDPIDNGVKYGLVALTAVE